MSRGHEQPLAEGTTGQEDAPSYAADVPLLLPTKPVSPTCVTSTFLSVQHVPYPSTPPECSLYKKTLLRGSVAAASPPPHPPFEGLSVSGVTSHPFLSSQAASADLEPVVSSTTPPIRLPNIEYLTLSDNAEMDQNYSPASPASPFPRLQLPTDIPSPSTLGLSISKEELYDDLIARFVKRAMEEFGKESAHCREPDSGWQAKQIANYALEQHNRDKNNKVKYDLVEATRSCYIMDGRGCYTHVNFIARAKKVDSENQLFFAEVRDEEESEVLTCFCCLEGKGLIGGVNTDEIGKLPTSKLDLEHCYACGEDILHPKDGASYEAGHCTSLGYYDDD